MSEDKSYVRTRFRIQGDLRFISHHDLMRLFARALRRSELPLAVSGGYNPRLKMSLPAALSVGMAGDNEPFDFELTRWVKPSEIEKILSAELPEQVDLKSVQIAAKKPSRNPSELSYRVPLLRGSSLTERRIQEVLDRSQIVVQREKKDETKEVDIRPFIKALRVRDQAVHMLLKFTQRGTARPEEVLQALGCQPDVDYLESQIRRTDVNLSSSL